MKFINVIKNFLGSRFLEQNRGTITQTDGCNNQRFDFKIYKKLLVRNNTLMQETLLHFYTHESGATCIRQRAVHVVCHIYNGLHLLNAPGPPSDTCLLQKDLLFGH